MRRRRDRPSIWTQNRRASRAARPSASLYRRARGSDTPGSCTGPWGSWAAGSVPAGALAARRSAAPPARREGVRGRPPRRGPVGSGTAALTAGSPPAARSRGGPGTGRGSPRRRRSSGWGRRRATAARPPAPRARGCRPLAAASGRPGLPPQGRPCDAGAARRSPGWGTPALRYGVQLQPRWPGAKGCFRSVWLPGLWSTRLKKLQDGSVVHGWPFTPFGWFSISIYRLSYLGNPFQNVYILVFSVWNPLNVIPNIWWRGCSH